MWYCFEILKKLIISLFYLQPKPTCVSYKNRISHRYSKSEYLVRFIDEIFGVTHFNIERKINNVLQSKLKYCINLSVYPDGRFCVDSSNGLLSLVTLPAFCYRDDVLKRWMLSLVKWMALTSVDTCHSHKGPKHGYWKTTDFNCTNLDLYKTIIFQYTGWR